ncbi:hypothetical protein ACFSKM_04705 [Ancylobacter dichloromethanicus]
MGLAAPGTGLSDLFKTRLPVALRNGGRRFREPGTCCVAASFFPHCGMNFRNRGKTCHVTIISAIRDIFLVCEKNDGCAFMLGKRHGPPMA